MPDDEYAKMMHFRLEEAILQRLYAYTTIEPRNIVRDSSGTIAQVSLTWSEFVHLVGEAGYLND